jgi:hypothetical protein
MPYRTPDDPRTIRRLPMLERLTVKTPCNASWEEMVGDGHVRRCGPCNRDVYDLGSMDADEAEVFLDEHLASTGTLPCARLYRRPDGRVMTSPCGAAIDQRHRMRVAGGLAMVVTAVATALGANPPTLGPDDPLEIERAIEVPAHDVEPAYAEIGELTLDP